MHDGDGNRVRKTVNGRTTLYVVDDRNLTGYAQVLEEHVFTLNPQLSTLNRAYTYGHDLIAQDQVWNNQWVLSFYGYDGHGSVRLLTDVAGTVTDAYDYDAFGVLLTQSSVYQTPPPNHYGYTGEQWDADLGFYYLRARYSNPETGRFWTMDSYEGQSQDPLTLHKYLYCHANPVNGVDPSGHQSLTGGSARKIELQLDYAGDGADDYLTVANVWNAYAGSGNPDRIYVLILPGDDLFSKVAETLREHNLRPGVDLITRINIAGHGIPGDIGFDRPDAANITLSSLQDVNSPQSRLLYYLHPFTAHVCTVRLDSCGMAAVSSTGVDGKDMMKIMATRLRAKVIGYEGDYFVIGLGQEWTAYSDGSIRKTWSLGNMLLRKITIPQIVIPLP